MNRERETEPRAWAWTMRGKCAGYWDELVLWDCHGQPLGRRYGLDIYAPDGTYLGELMESNRLAVNHAKIGLHGPAFLPFPSRPVSDIPPDLEPRHLPIGYEDFPS